MIESSLSKLDDKGVFTIVKVENVEKKVGKETITEVNIETEEEFDRVKNFYTSRKMIVAKFYDNGKPTTLTEDIQKGKKYRVKIITQKFGNGKEDYDIAKSWFPFIILKKNSLCRTIRNELEILFFKIKMIYWNPSGSTINFDLTNIWSKIANIP